MNAYRIEFITPLFSRGAYDDRPEVRAASIRGQLHWWFRALGGSYSDERTIFGGVHGGAVASRIVVRVADLPSTPAPPVWLPTLPHKPGGQNPRNAPNAPRCAFPAGQTFRLLVSERLGGLDDRRRQQFHRALKAWLLAGSLGLRATRGAGSIHWDGAPLTRAAFLNSLAETLDQAPLRFALLDEPFATAEQARRIITETISHQAMADIGYPLGAVAQGREDPAPPRKTSPLRLTVRRLEGGFFILAVWDARRTVTNNTPEQLRQAIDRLANGTPLSKPTELGRLLRASHLC